MNLYAIDGHYSIAVVAAHSQEEALESVRLLPAFTELKIIKQWSFEELNRRVSPIVIAAYAA